MPLLCFCRHSPELSLGDYKRLRVWRNAHTVTCALYSITRAFPRTDQFVLGNQIRRAAISIGANIAEGCGRTGDGELHRFLNIALGSANELRYLLEVAMDVGVLPRATGSPTVEAVDDIRRMLAGLAGAAPQGRWSSPTKRARP
jgi:four helix bundle protein